MKFRLVLKPLSTSANPLISFQGGSFHKQKSPGLGWWTARKALNHSIVNVFTTTGLCRPLIRALLDLAASSMALVSSLIANTFQRVIEIAGGEVLKMISKIFAKYFLPLAITLTISVFLTYQSVLFYWWIASKVELGKKLQVSSPLSKNLIIYIYTSFFFFFF